MTQRIEVSLLFCEDFRVDEGSKPMLIGVLSPLFYTNPNPGESDRVHLITFLHATPDVAEVPLRLQTSIEMPGAEPIRKSQRAVVPRPDDVTDDPWGAYLPVAIDIDEWQDGALVTAELQAGEASAHAHLRCRFYAEETSTPKKPRRRTKGPNAALPARKREVAQ